MVYIDILFIPGINAIGNCEYIKIRFEIQKFKNSYY